jgi:hypothetical protein
MRYHFNISYSKGFNQVSDWLRQHATENPLLALGDGLHGSYFIIVAPVAELGQWQQQELDAGRAVSAALCAIEVMPQFSVMRVNLECTDDARAATALFVQNLFNRFPDYAVYDEDKDQDITDLVRADAGVLFDA